MIKARQSTNKVNQADLILLVFYELQKEIKDEIKDDILHRIICHLNEYSQPPFKFIIEPTTYVGELESNLRSLEKRHCVDETIIIHDGEFPKYYYELTKYGHVAVEELIEKMEIQNPQLLEIVSSTVNKVLSSYTEFSKE